MKQSLLFDMSDEDYANATSYHIRRIFRAIEEHYSYEKLMEDLRIWVFIIGPYIDEGSFVPRAGMEHGIFINKINGSLSSWINFEIFGHLYTLWGDDIKKEEFKQKIEGFKKIGKELFMQNNDLKKIKLLKIETSNTMN